MITREKKIEDYNELIALFAAAKGYIEAAHRERVGLCRAILLIYAAGGCSPRIANIAGDIVRRSIAPSVYYENWFRDNGFRVPKDMVKQRMKWLDALIKQAKAERDALKEATVKMVP